MNTNPTKTSRARVIVPLLVLAVAAALIAVVLVINNGGTKAGAQTGAEVADSDTENVVDTEVAGEEDGDVVADVDQDADAPDLSLLETRQEGDPLAVGAVDAPVGMVVFSDYQCPYCGRWNEDTLPVMLDYVDEGLLRIEWRDANFFGEASEEAAKAAYAAGMQGKFLEYNNALFPDGNKLSPEALTVPALISLAGELGLDQAQFEADFTSPETAKIVEEHAAFARAVGVASTPTFALGGTPIVGAQPTEVFVQTFEDALASKLG